MPFDSVYGKAQLPGYLLVAVSGDKEFKYLDFTRSQMPQVRDRGLITHTVQQIRRYGVGDD